MTARRARRRFATVVLLTTLPAAIAAGPAEAVHWPFFGGDNGHSGYQPIDEGDVPVPFLYAKNEPFIKTSIVTTTGNPATQRLAYGTRDGFVHLQILGTGAPVGAETGAQVDEGAADPDVFGTRSMVPGANGSSVSFVDTSGATGLGQLFAVHNDDDTAADAPDIEIAQIDETTGARVRADIDVAGSDGFTIESSAVATGAGAGGSRIIFFVARRTTDPTDARLFRVPVTGDAATSASIVNGAGATATGDIEATPLASPAIVFRNDATGVAAARVAVGTKPTLKLFSTAADLALVDESADLGGPVQTPSVPVQPNGMTPNPAGPVTTAPSIYVASAVAGDDTAVHKLNNNATFTPATASRTVAGGPAPALSTDQETEAQIDEAKVFVTTGENLYFLSTANLGEAGTFSRTPLQPGTTGFGQTTAAASGELVHVTNDQAQQFILRLSDGQAVSSAEFAPNGAATAAPNTGVGQPSLSRGFVQYAGGNGAFVYRTTDADVPTVSILAPAEGATLIGPTTISATASDTRGIGSVQFRLNGQAIGGLDTAPDAGSPFAPGAGATYSTDFDAATVPNGSYLVGAVATDASGLTTISAQRRVTISNGPGQGAGGDDRPPTVAFVAPAANALVGSPTIMSATAVDDRAVADVTFVVGDVVCKVAAAQGPGLPYVCPATFTGADVGRISLFAVATDSTGQTGSAVRIVRVDRFTPRAVTSAATPGRDRRAPYTFRSSGRVRLPTRVTPSQACGEGIVSVQVKRGTATTVSTRRVTLRRDCTYATSVTFGNRSRLGRSGRLKVTARFLGNKVLKARSARSRFVRAG